ncbi:hypothetical protein K788_0002105 (plasmid) [Paraburkholderia caribensis MBA4]|uniref:Uncharacterized protein n=1 Tax=Paraburkholderia caribensis MBA4 TaxID=1323664 RepID=A0A0P0RPW4_9BURK|nr:hypothetical protein K788_0002105 [Paraburkholderia caribensis MBA4]
MRFFPRGHCRVRLSRDSVSVLRVNGSRKTTPVPVERPLPVLAVAATPDALSASIAAALDEADAARMAVHATLDDDLVRYFIVTPPANGARMQDLRAAAGVRFQMLYGEPLSDWHLAADWQCAAPFLACAVSRGLHAALQIAVDAQRASLASVTPHFVAAWNRTRHRLGADAWLATLGEHALTLGLVAGAKKPRLAAVRTLPLPKAIPSMAWLRDQLSRAALLDNVAAPSVLHIHGCPPDGWQTDPASSADAGLSVQWHSQR